MQLAGDTAMEAGREVVEKGVPRVMVSDSRQKAEKDVQSFFNFADMQMSF